MARRNGFTRIGGSTYPCDICGRTTRHTGVQSLGSKTCPQCWDLAGIENAISDGDTDDYRAQIAALTSDIAAKGGSLAQWADLMAL